MSYTSLPTIPSRQQGMVLIIALIILATLTILGVSGMTTTSLQERMSANLHDRQIAFQTAEAALRAGENYIQTTPVIDLTQYTSACTGGKCDCSSPSGCSVYWTDPTIWSNSGKHFTLAANTFTQVAAQPEYIIEYMGLVNPPGVPPGTTPSITNGASQMFRITALGTGQSPNAKVMLQSTYKK